ncbi:MAG TPA: hypothetical protein ENH84_06690 [Phycisphaerae bacterium]|nr:hypothetical protein [Phycisphaerae bacterium]
MICCMLIPAVWFVGCAKQPAPITMDTTGVAPKVDFSDLAAVLEEVVDKKGYIETEKFEPLSDRLIRQLKLLAVTGPTATPGLFPDPEQRLAYWYNARTAWAMELAMRRHKSKLIRPDELGTITFPLDGRRMTLTEIDAKLNTTGGYHAVIAAPGSNLRRASLPEKPFDAKTIRVEIKTRFGAFVNDTERFVIDVATMEIRFPPVFWKYREEILADYARDGGGPQATLTTALLSQVSGSALRRLQDAVGYKCVENHQAGELVLVE